MSQKQTWSITKTWGFSMSLSLFSVDWKSLIKWKHICFVRKHFLCELAMASLSVFHQLPHTPPNKRLDGVDQEEIFSEYDKKCIKQSFSRITESIFNLWRLVNLIWSHTRVKNQRGRLWAPSCGRRTADGRRDASVFVVSPGAVVIFSPCAHVV